MAHNHKHTSYSLYILFCFFSSFSLSGCSGQELAPVKGVLSAKVISKFDNTFYAYVVDPTEAKLQIFWRDEEEKNYGSIANLKDKLADKQQELVFATNAGMYTENRSPLGLYVEQGKQLVPLNTATGFETNFYMEPNGVFLINNNGTAAVVRTENYPQVQDGVRFATQSGPMLLHEHTINAKFTQGSKNKYVRNGVGMISDRKVVFIISDKPVNFYDFASVFKEEFGCSDALYLDGFVSRMYCPEVKRKDTDGNFGGIIGVIR